MSDRHLDELATRSAEKIHGGARDAICLAVPQADLAEAPLERPLRVFDISAGPGHTSLWLAARDHHVILVEPAQSILNGARQCLTETGQVAEFIQVPWQEPLGRLTESHDLVLCHAMLEWLAEPHAILPVLYQPYAPGGWLPLAFYNRDTLIYRNLLKGHFCRLRKERFIDEGRGLTPQCPFDPRELEQVLAARWRIETRSGVRMFYDYMLSELQAKTERFDLVEMELAYRRHPTFVGLGRYLYQLCRPQWKAQNAV